MPLMRPRPAAGTAADPRVVDAASLEALYRSIGYPNGAGHYETEAARLVAVRVLFEVAGRLPVGSLSRR